MSATVNESLSADAGCGTVFDNQSQSWGTLLSLLTVTSNAAASCSSPNRILSTTGKATGSWNASQNGGQIKLNNIGWRSTANVTNGSAAANLATDYSYTFSANQNVTFYLRYDVALTSDTNNGGAGLNGFTVNLAGITSNLGIGTSGLLTYGLIGGDTYTLTIANDASASGIGGGVIDLMDGSFRFQAAPEPSSVILLGSGFLGLLATARRKFSN